MTGRRGGARAGFARVWAALAALLAATFVCGAVHAAAAGSRPAWGSAALRAVPVFGATPLASDPEERIEVTLERAEDAEPSDNPNAVLVDAILRDGAGNVPKLTYRVFASVAPYLPDPGVDATPSKPEPCRQPHFSTNPEIDEGVFRCSYLVDFPDTWTFDVTVKRLTSTGLVKVAHVQATFPVNDAVKLEGLAGLQYAVKANPFDVLLLEIHFAAAASWLLVVAAMAFLAVPRLRRMLSTFAMYALEIRLYFLNGLMWVMFGTVFVTGSLLMATRAAYSPPFSVSAWDDVSGLPYGMTYFTALYLKILTFTVMGVASLVLGTEAARRARIVEGSVGPDTSDDEFWRRLHFHDAMRDTGERVAERRPEAAAGGAATAVLTARPRLAVLTESASPRTLWLCAFALAGGVGVIGVCVTVLKYTHELIQMFLAAKAVADAE